MARAEAGVGVRSAIPSKVRHRYQDHSQLAALAITDGRPSSHDREEVAARLTETLASWGCWDDSWAVPTSGGITQRLGPEPLELLFDLWLRRWPGC